MRMAANEQFRTMGNEVLFDSWCIPGRMSANVGHKNGYRLAFPNQFFRVYSSYILPINIAKNTMQRQTCLLAQTVGNIDASKITRMPYFMAVFQVLKDHFVQEIVCV